MAVAFRTYADCPTEQVPSGVSLSWPWVEEFTDSEERIHFLHSQGFAVMTEEQYERYKKTHSPMLNVLGVIKSASDFGSELASEFAAENVLMGITQDGMTGLVMERLSSVTDALNTGSLYEAITRLKTLPPDSFDLKYITSARVLAFMNKIEGYLGLPLSS